MGRTSLPLSKTVEDCNIFVPGFYVDGMDGYPCPTVRLPAISPAPRPPESCLRGRPYDALRFISLRAQLIFDESMMTPFGLAGKLVPQWGQERLPCQHRFAIQQPISVDMRPEARLLRPARRASVELPCQHRRT